MTAVESTHLSADNQRLRQDVTGLRVALASLSETNDALRRENQRWRDILRLVVMETERHRLAVESFSREV